MTSFWIIILDLLRFHTPLKIYRSNCENRENMEFKIGVNPNINHQIFDFIESILHSESKEGRRYMADSRSLFVFQGA